MSVAADPKRRERIELLLGYYRDVRDGLYEQRNADGVPGICRAMKHPAYRELERLLPVLKERFPKFHAHLIAHYLGYWERRIARCPKCGRKELAGYINRTCKHSVGRSGTFQPFIERVIDEPSQKVVDAVDWLAEHWTTWGCWEKRDDGEGGSKLVRINSDEIPEDVLSIESERKLRAVA